jgi:hypothetical protein
MKTHHVWWPHLVRDRIFNPFVSLLDRKLTSDRIEVTDAEEEEGEGDEKAAEQPTDRSSTDK